MFGLGTALKEIFLTYSTQFVFSTIRLVPGNAVMVAIDMCGKSPITGEWIYGIVWKHVYFSIFVVFIVHTTSILKLVFPTIVFPTISALTVTLVAVLLPLLLLSLLLLFLLIYFFRYFSLFVYLFIYLFVYFSFLFTYSFIYLWLFLLLQLLFLFLLLLLPSRLLVLLLESLLSFVCVGLLLLLVWCWFFQSWFCCLCQVLL